MILDGKKLAAEIKQDLKKQVNELNGKMPHCVVLLASSDNASQVYVKNKEKAFKEVGMLSTVYKFDSDVTNDQMLEVIDYLNADDEVDGILIQLPLYKHLDRDVLINRIDVNKDVDGLVKLSQIHDQGLIPCTPQGIVKLLESNKIDLTGKHVVIVNRSNLVGKPLARLMLNKNATVTICHSYTKNLKKITKLADILVVATGQMGIITKDMIKKGVVIVDVGIHKTDQGYVGDVDSECYELASHYTPVPGGVGPMTVTMLLHNTYLASKRRLNHD